MTRRERWQIAWFVLACCSVTVAINWAVAQKIAQPTAQPRLKLRGDFDVITFENGSTWYLKQGSLNAIWAIPRDQQEKLGVKTKMYGNGYEISIPEEVVDILDDLYSADIEELQELKQQLEESRQAVR